MKKFTAIILLTIYSFAALGIGVKQFYCCGNLKSTSLTIKVAEEASCPKDKAQERLKKAKCCEFKIQKAKVDDNYNASLKTKLNFDQSIAIFSNQNQFEIAQPLFSEIKLDFSKSNSPPINRANPIYLENRNFRI